MHFLVLYTIVPIICIGIFQLIPQDFLHYVHSFHHFIFCAFIIYWALEWSQKHILCERVDPLPRAVLITGCGTGFGHAFTKKLDAAGYTVFAGVRNINCDGAVDLKNICSGRTHVIELDVTKEESVQKAFEYISNVLINQELWAVVNNAGIFQGSSVEFTGMDIYNQVMETNTFGLIRVTKVFLPLLRKSKGRMIAVTSPMGRNALPHASAYGMSKAAAISFCDALRQEVQVWGVKIISFEPELYNTSIGDHAKLSKYFGNSWDSVPEDLKKLYGSDYDKRLMSFIENFFSNGSDKLYQVTDDMYDAVSLVNPHYVYKTRRNIFVRFFLFFLEQMPRPITDFIQRITLSIFTGCPLSFIA